MVTEGEVERYWYCFLTAGRERARDGVMILRETQAARGKTANTLVTREKPPVEALLKACGDE